MGVPGKEAGVLESPEKVDLWALVTGRAWEVFKSEGKSWEASDVKSLSR